MSTICLAWQGEGIMADRAAVIIRWGIHMWQVATVACRWRLHCFTTSVLSPQHTPHVAKPISDYAHPMLQQDKRVPANSPPCQLLSANTPNIEAETKSTWSSTQIHTVISSELLNACSIRQLIPTASILITQNQYSSWWPGGIAGCLELRSS